MVGAHFAPAQGGVFTSPRVGAAMAALDAMGAHGTGQSSWGPTGFAFADSEDTAQNLRRGLVGRGLAVGMLWFSAWSLFDEYLIQETTGTAYISSGDVLVIAPFLLVLVAILAVATSTVTLWRYLRV